MRPRFDERDALLVYFAAPVKEAQQRIAKGQLQAREVDFVVLMKFSITIENAARGERVRVGVKIEQTPKRLRRNRERRHRPVELRKSRAKMPLDDSIDDTTEIAMEFSIEQKRRSNDLGDGENQWRIRHRRQHVFDHALGPLGGSAFSAARTKAARLARKWQQAFGLAVAATQTKGLSTAV